MLRRLTIVIALLAFCSAAVAAAAPPRRTSAPARSAIKARTSKAGAAKAKAGKASAAQAKAAKPDSTARLAGGPRRLEDIHIEGEIPAPQVLFVTARDQRRFTRFHHQRYLRTSLQVGETTQLPTRIALTSHPPDTTGAP